MKKCYAPLLFLFPFFATAQSHPFELSTFYETISAKNVIKKTTDFNFSGPIRSVKETLLITLPPDSKEQDSVRVTRYHFNRNGFLDTLARGDSAGKLQNSGSYYEVYDFDKTGQKPEAFTKYDGSYYAHVIKKTFNADGFLTRERFEARFDKNPEVLHYTAYYTYKNNYRELAIHYAYDKPQTHYDRRDDGTWKFTFNNARQLTSEVHREEEFGSSMSVLYDTLWKLPATMFYTERCATENSCLRLIKGITYDERGRKKTEGLSDATIRNSTWSYSYCFTYAYNDTGALVKSTDCATGGQPWFRLSKKQAPEQMPATKTDPLPYTAYEYIYDTQGNWIEQRKYEMGGKPAKKLLQVVKRELGYW